MVRRIVIFGRILFVYGFLCRPGVVRGVYTSSRKHRCWHSWWIPEGNIRLPDSNYYSVLDKKMTGQRCSPPFVQHNDRRDRYVSI
jgi:hypothetical protein